MRRGRDEVTAELDGVTGTKPGVFLRYSWHMRTKNNTYTVHTWILDNAQGPTAQAAQ